MRRYSTRLLLAACVVAMLPACKRSPEAVSTTVASPVSQASDAQAFQRDLEGIWSTTRREGDDAEEIFAIQWSAQDGLQVVRGDQWLPGKVEDVDLANNTLAFHITSDVGPSETVTLRKVQDVKDSAAFTLRLTWEAGQVDALAFVRRLTQRDRAMVAEAIAKARQQAAVGDGPEKSLRCNGAQDSLRLELICNDQAFATEDRRVMLLLDELSVRHPDGDKTAVAANRQLDACKTQKCLRDGYAQWQTYLDENFDLTQEVW